MSWLSVCLTLQVSLDDSDNHLMLFWCFYNADFLVCCSCPKLRFCTVAQWTCRITLLGCLDCRLGLVHIEETQCAWASVKGTFPEHACAMQSLLMSLWASSAGTLRGTPQASGTRPLQASGRLSGSSR